CCSTSLLMFHASLSFALPCLFRRLLHAFQHAPGPHPRPRHLRRVLLKQRKGQLSRRLGRHLLQLRCWLPRRSFLLPLPKPLRARSIRQLFVLRRHLIVAFCSRHVERRTCAARHVLRRRRLPFLPVLMILFWFGLLL